jgi:hypothetical protein
MKPDFAKQESNIKYGLALCKVPPGHHTELLNFIMCGRPLSPFLKTLLGNAPLSEVMEVANIIERYTAFDVVHFMNHFAPVHCWRSPSNVDLWINKGGFIGVYNQAATNRGLAIPEEQLAAVESAWAN